VTRESWHRVAEHVMAPMLHRYTGRIGLRATHRGVGTPEFDIDGIRSQLRLEGTTLVSLHDSTETWIPLTTVGELAEQLGIEPGAPDGLYEPVTDPDPVAPLRTDRAEAGALGEWVALVDDALGRFRTLHRERSPLLAQLWPEHFDLAMSMDEINFGGALGDHAAGGRPEPYLYAGPWQPLTGSFWNEPYGAALDATDVTGVDDALRFFEAALAAAAHDRSRA
jgi:hypothetical protein